MIPMCLLPVLILLSPVAAGSVFQEYSTVVSKLNRRAEDLSTAVPLDESLLAIQIGGIVGAYVIFVAILLSLLLLVGRRLRRAVQASNYSLHVEMMKPAKPPVSLDPSPVTPLSATLPSPNRTHSFNQSWSSLGKAPHSHMAGNGSAATIDESVLASDRRRAQEEMEMLYAAVMEHDARKELAMETGRDEKEIQSPDMVYTSPFSDRSSRVSEGPSFAPMKSPTSPRSNSRLSRISSLSLFNSNSNSSSQSQPNASSKTPANTSKILRSPRFNLRKMSISSPLASPDVTATNSYGEQPPLTPRIYHPPPPPAPPARINRTPVEKVVGASRAPAPAPLSLSTAGHGKGPSSLPFRDAFPLQSAPATKTTVLERPVKPLNGPRTGMPTPYSPYMPFTPVTPLTPSRMVTKRQRKREAKDNGLRVLDENDVVQDDSDVWG
ncbi:hypothetical protein P168DRAFT_290433 [Aspergillus campestris IBT 28561]|uniref:Uncharacterized protein n=1 Tax=Aspergillus campestris (strain IBT 28561) TaxID=1392248 RepID=A0A2I1D3A8_ASPC2|nr:uncharacterized protein P168DRAFT_290433 [Aspergillus campestris IBT 28561]PKY04354.1 hypothetical protein P168DRAFT_290433 [Aspergillus campestris IBT 28561]